MHRGAGPHDGRGWCSRSTALYLGLVLVWQPAGFSDISVYRAEAQALSDGMDLYGPLPGVHGLGTYPPFAAAVFTPLLLVRTRSQTCCRSSSTSCSWSPRRTSPCAAHDAGDLRVGVPLLAAVALWCEPVMLNNGFGQINLLILCLVLWDFSLPEDSRWRGVGIGLAAALKVTPGIFIVYLLVTKRFRAARGHRHPRRDPRPGPARPLVHVGLLDAPRLRPETGGTARELAQPVRARLARPGHPQRRHRWGRHGRDGPDRSSSGWRRPRTATAAPATPRPARCRARRAHRVADPVEPPLGLVPAAAGVAWYGGARLVHPDLPRLLDVRVGFVPHGDHVELRTQPRRRRDVRPVRRLRRRVGDRRRGRRL